MHTYINLLQVNKSLFLIAYTFHLQQNHKYFFSVCKQLILKLPEITLFIFELPGKAWVLSISKTENFQNHSGIPNPFTYSLKRTY